MMSTEAYPSTVITRRNSLPRLMRIGSTAALALVIAASCDSKGDEAVSTTSALETAAATAPATTTQPSPPSTYTPPGPKILLEGSRIKEVQQFGAKTFPDYTHASGLGPDLPKDTSVVVDCLATGPEEAAPTAKGKWYHMIEPDKYAGYYVAANTFENGDTSGPLTDQPAVDPAVPPCP